MLKSKYFTSQITLKNRFEKIYPQTIITIKKGNKNKGLELCTNEKILEEFNYLKQEIDNNVEYEKRLEENNNLNRYKDIRPFKDNLVKIDLGNKYINASWIHIPKSHYFIVTQGPMDSTIDDFCEMAYKYNANVIVMLCLLEENNKKKCANYWDNKNIKNFEFKEINEEFDINGIRLRNFEFKRQKDTFPKNIIQLHYTCWKDHTAPDKEAYHKLINLMILMDYYKGNTPGIVHCSAGVGRTGTFIALYNLYCEIMKQIKDDTKKEIKFSIMNTVRQLKEMRAHLVENEDQYLFLYQFVNILLDEHN